MIYQFPHCTVIVTVDRVSTLFPFGDDPAQYPASSRAVTTEPERLNALEATLAAHLLSYAMRGTPSPHAWLAAGRTFDDEPLFQRRVEATYDREAEQRLVVEFVTCAHGLPHEPAVLAPLGDTLDALVERFAWFVLAPAYVNVVRL